MLSCQYTFTLRYKQWVDLIGELTRDSSLRSELAVGKNFPTAQLFILLQLTYYLFTLK